MTRTNTLGHAVAEMERDLDETKRQLSFAQHSLDNADRFIGRQHREIMELHEELFRPFHSVIQQMRMEGERRFTHDLERTETIWRCRFVTPDFAFITTHGYDLTARQRLDLIDSAVELFRKWFEQQLKANGI